MVEGVEASPVEGTGEGRRITGVKSEVSFNLLSTVNRS